MELVVSLVFLTGPVLANASMLASVPGVGKTFVGVVRLRDGSVEALVVLSGQRITISGVLSESS